MANYWYAGAKQRIMDHAHTGAINLTADTIKVALMSTGHAESQTAHTHWSDVSGDQITALAYVPTGIGTDSITLNGTTGTYDCTDTVLSGIGGGPDGTFDQLIVYKDTGTPATSPLISHHDVNETTTNGGDITLQWDTLGILTLS